MAVAALLKFIQGATVGTAGQALLGALTTAVQVSNGAAAPGPVLTTTFTVVAVPSGSAVPLGTAQTGATTTWTFSPDVRGCFIIQITVADASGNVASDIRAFGIKTVSGHLIPSFTGDANSLNFGGQATGWDVYMEAWLQALELLLTPVAIFSGTLTGPSQTGTLSFSLPNTVTLANVVCKAWVLSTAGSTELVGDDNVVATQCAWKLVAGVAYVSTFQRGQPYISGDASMSGTSFTPGASGPNGTIVYATGSGIDPTTVVQFVITVSED